MEFNELKLKIENLKKETGAIILAHYYTRPEIQELADFLGDSLELSRKAAETDAETIVFCGVHFMAETAAILSPKKRVLIPKLRAGCSLAESITSYEIIKWKEKNPDGLVVSYVNTTADVKSVTDYCVTSANAVRIVEKLPADSKILFLPDYNLGNYIKKVTGREMEIWDGNCCVHQRITADMVFAKHQEYPEALVLMHPESFCSHDDRILESPFVKIASTSGILRDAAASDCKQFIIATENETLYKLRKDNPNKEFIPVDNRTVCGSMKRVTAESIYEALLHNQYEVKIPQHIQEKAIQPIKRMLEF
ncbi:MAG: quinolinate synthase NadA [Bacteroidales bacterium]